MALGKRRSRKGEVDPFARAKDYKFVFGTTQGKLVLADILRRTRVLSTTFAKDPHETAFREGERNVGLMILSEVSLDIEGAKALLNEEGY